jgi:hypothetical protein
MRQIIDLDEGPDDLVAWERDTAWLAEIRDELERMLADRPDGDLTVPAKYSALVSLEAALLQQQKHRRSLVT